MKKITILLTSLLLMTGILLTSCSKDEVLTNESGLNFSKENIDINDYKVNLTPIELAKETGIIVDHEEFKKEMRKTKQIIKVKEITTPEVIDWLHRKKNISPDSAICYGDQDCPQPLKCITQCIWIGEGEMKGTVRACRIDEWKDEKNMKFMYELGFCLEWKNQLS